MYIFIRSKIYSSHLGNLKLKKKIITKAFSKSLKVFLCLTSPSLSFSHIPRKPVLELTYSRGTDNSVSQLVLISFLETTTF